MQKTQLVIGTLVLVLMVMVTIAVIFPNQGNVNTNALTFEDLNQYGLDTSNAYRAEDGTVKGWSIDFSNAKSAESVVEVVEPTPKIFD
jgi:hypothetical protein